MPKITKANEVVRRALERKSKSQVLPNEIEPNGSSVLLKKKRHMSGLMCPPTSFLANEKTGEDRT